MGQPTSFITTCPPDGGDFFAVKIEIQCLCVTVQYHVYWLDPVGQLRLSSAKRCPVRQNAWFEQVERFAVQFIKACCRFTVWRSRVVDSDLYHKDVFDSGPIPPII
jgi:hypothetical protein